MNPSGGILAGLAWCVLVACAPAGPGVRAPDGGAPGQETAPAHIVTAAPRAYVLALDDATRRCLLERLERGDLRIARLTLGGLRPRSAQALQGVRLFIERPEANVATARDDAHAAGAFVLGPEAEQTYLLNIAPTLSALWRSGALDRDVLSSDGDGLRLTLVAEPSEDTEALPQDFALSIGTVQLDVPCE